MILNADTAATAAEHLLQIKAINLNTEHPYTWVSGLRSPIYCDNRLILSYPKIRTFVRQEITGGIQQIFGNVDLIAGVATGGIAIGALVAQDLGLPFVYVRPEKKKHGLTNQIEGILEAGQSVVVIEDLVSTGKSSLNAVRTLREAGAIIKGMIAIFSYGLEESQENFAKENCKLYTLTSYEQLIIKAEEMGFIQADDLKSLADWKNDPNTWSI